MQTNEYSRPATLTDLKKVIQSLNDQGAEYLLIGGYALFSHGYHRATEDIDLLVPAKATASKAILKGLLVLEDRESANIDPEWFDEGENIRLADEVIVDLLFKTCEETYETLLPHMETIDLDGIPVRTLNLEGLLKTKQSNREKDAMDRMVLERVLNALRERSSTRSKG
ncbi:MAG: nucleotidyltransferase [Sedimenticola sp.]